MRCYHLPNLKRIYFSAVSGDGISLLMQEAVYSSYRWPPCGTLLHDHSRRLHVAKAEKAQVDVHHDTFQCYICVTHQNEKVAVC